MIRTGFVAAIVALGIGVGAKASDRLPKSIGLEEIHDSTPDLEIADSAGKHQKISALRGHAVVLHFWATWCAPCLVEMPSLLKAIEETTAPDVRFVAISVDEPARRAEVKKFLAGLKPPVETEMIVESAASRRFYAWGIPMTYFLDARGRIVARARGSKAWNKVSRKDLETFLRSLTSD